MINPLEGSNPSPSARWTNVREALARSSERRRSGESGGRARCATASAPAWPGAVLVAPATPVVCTPGDNLAIHVAVASAPSGSALVVSVGDVPELGYWGEVLTTGAQSRGIAGLVIDGGVRDISALERLGFPVFSSTIALRGATKLRPGTVGAPATVGDVEVRTGDWIVGDADGVTVVPGAQLDDVIAAGRARGAEGSAHVRPAACGQDDGRAARPRPRPHHRHALTATRLGTGSRTTPIRRRVRRRGSAASRRRAPRPRRARRAAPCARRVATEAEPMCGSSTVRGALEQRRVRSRARARTRRCPAAKMRPSCNAAASAASSTTVPRAVLTSTACGRSRRRRRSSIEMVRVGATRRVQRDDVGLARATRRGRRRSPARRCRAACGAARACRTRGARARPRARSARSRRHRASRRARRRRGTG